MEFPLQLWSEEKIEPVNDSSFTNAIHFKLLKHATSPSISSKDFIFDQISPDIINQLDSSQGASPLHYASMHGNVPMVTVLLQNGADVNILDGNKKVTPLACAAAYGHLDVVKLLIAHNCDVNVGLNNCDKKQRPPLVWAVKANQPEVVRFLLENNATQNSPVPFSETPIHTAVMSGNPEILEMLIKAQGKNVKADFQMGDEKFTPLHLAASGQYPNSLEICKILVEQGYVEVNAVNASEMTALHLAAESHNEEIVKFLLSKWSKVDAVDKDGKTPLHYTINDSEYALKCMETLIIKGKCDINHKDKQGNTPLHTAAINGTGCAAQVLLMHGADFSIKSGSTTALRILNRKIPELKDILNRVFDSAVSVSSFREWGTAENRQDCKVKVNYKYVLPSEPNIASGDFSSDNQHNKRNNRGARMGFFGNKDAAGGGEDGPGHQRWARRKETAKMKCLVDEGLACLLTHPLIHSFLELKWNKARYVFFPTFVLKGIFLVLFSLYVEMPFALNGKLIGMEGVDIPTFNISIDNETFGFNNPIFLKPPTPPWYLVMYIGVVTLSGINNFMELLQILQFPKTQLLTVHPWISCAVFAIICHMNPENWNRTADPLERTVAAAGILLAWVELWYFMSRFPVIGLSIRVFFQVLKNFGNFMMPHFCLLTGFLLSFSLLIPENPEFLNLPFAATKVVRIFAGDNEIVKEGKDEWETKGPSWKEWASRTILLYIYTSYVLIVAIVLANLLIGLAVNDLQGIYAGAAIEKLANQTILINTLESNFGGKLKNWLPKGLFSKSCFPKGYFKKYTINLFHPSDLHKLLTFKPYDSRDTKLSKELKMALFNIANDPKKMEKSASSNRDSKVDNVVTSAPSKHIQQWKMAAKNVANLVIDDDEKALRRIVSEVVAKFLAEKKKDAIAQDQ